MENGFIKLYRQIQNWEWYTDSATVHFFIHCILSANWKDKKWKGQEVKRGQFITSLSNLSIQTGLSVKQVRTRIDRLIDSGEIEQEGTQWTKITVCKYDTYQPKHENEGTQKAQKGHTKGTQRATTKEVKEYKEGKEDIVTTHVDDEPTETELQSQIIAQYLLDSICEWDTSHRYNKNEPSLDGWVKDIDRAIRLDGRTPQQLKYIIDFVFRTNHKEAQFWAPNIQSGKKLREQFDKVKNQIKTKAQNNEATKAKQYSNEIFG